MKRSSFSNQLQRTWHYKDDNSKQFIIKSISKCVTFIQPNGYGTMSITSALMASMWGAWMVSGTRPSVEKNVCCSFQGANPSYIARRLVPVISSPPRDSMLLERIRGFILRARVIMISIIIQEIQVIKNSAYKAIFEQDIWVYKMYYASANILTAFTA